MVERRAALHAAAGDDDVLPLNDESLLVFSALAATVADLVRCAATCRRWRRLVSMDATFICRHVPRLADLFLRSLALGFFQSQTDIVTLPWFVPLSVIGGLPMVDRRNMDASYRFMRQTDS